jgi:hypothetical protein
MTRRVEAAGIEPLERIRENPSVLGEGGAKCGALCDETGPLDTGLAAVVEALPKLPKAIRAGIVVMVQAAQ